ncbi:hypothetical protein QYE76_054684 [Lolium multiflorum]|uniref:Reverse transcriptase domain-containing protein n=1 Tax=Lolium multiflorum TaxID=4521 RepID=A0AAD8SZJ7_LOLMU|nr:hypothetical protein QYE76_054684 [Lolium multiflorum]
MDALHLSIRENALYWKTRAKVRYALEGDENTKYFHATATCRLRRNSIPLLSVDGMDTSDHLGKASILHSYYSNLLGTVNPTTWRFDISSLYPSNYAPPDSLSGPFSPEEIKAAFASMNRQSSPEPDGFGPSFFNTFWTTVSLDILAVFSSFFDGSIDITRINRAFLVLLPKIDAAIDFRKAFDSVNWDSLLSILRARGFDDRWCLWMKKILDTGHTTILLNGVPGSWIRCRNSLRQGDPLSPYLFIIVADVLQRLIRKAWESGSLAHPLSFDTPCPVLQYADDTLILCQDSVEAADCLKQEGGFGIKDLHRQNRCLLLNFVHKLHQPNPLPWKTWYFSHTGRDFGDPSSSPSFLERIVQECLPLYRAITRVTVVDGRSTSFWLDKWLAGEPLATRFPALFSHSTRRHASVAAVVSEGLDLQGRLTGAAEAELRVLHEGADHRAIDSPSTPCFSSREAYHALSPARPVDTAASLTWSLRIPTKVKIFARLLDIDRLSTRANLFHKGCAPSSACAACGAPESGHHLFFDCPTAAELWARLDVPIPAGGFSIWDLRGPSWSPRAPGTSGLRPFFGPFGSPGTTSSSTGLATLPHRPSGVPATTFRFGDGGSALLSGSLLTTSDLFFSLVL